MLFGKIAVALSFVAVAFSNPIAKRELPYSFKAGLQTYGTFLSEANDLVKAFPKQHGTPAQVNAIVNKLSKAGDVDSAFATIQATLPEQNVTPEDDTEIENILLSFVPIAQDLLTNLLALRPAIKALFLDPHEVRDAVYITQVFVGSYLGGHLVAVRSGNGVHGFPLDSLVKFKVPFDNLFDQARIDWF